VNPWKRENTRKNKLALIWQRISEGSNDTPTNDKGSCQLLFTNLQLFFRGCGAYGGLFLGIATVDIPLASNQVRKNLLPPRVLSRDLKMVIQSTSGNSNQNRFLLDVIFVSLQIIST